MKRRSFTPVTITFIGVMAAMVYVVTLFRFPLLGSKVHFANAVCLLSGMLLGPLQGGIAAGLGSALYDATLGGYDFINVLITFVSKFAMGFVCGALMEAGGRNSRRVDRTVLAAVVGALTYVALYLLKSFIYGKFVYGYPADTLLPYLGGKLMPSLINAGAAIVAAPVFYHAVLPALKASGLGKHLGLE